MIQRIRTKEPRMHLIRTLTTAAVLLFVSANANALLIDFNSGLNPFFNYAGISTLSVPHSNDNSGYDNLGDVSGAGQIAFNPNAASPATFSLNGPGTFDLNSFIIAGAWGNQTLLIEGLAAASVVFSQNLAVTTAPQTALLNWAGIDQLRITTDPNGYTDTVAGGSGQHWALDNMLVNAPLQSVPEPATLSLLALGLVGSGLRRRRQAA